MLPGAGVMRRRRQRGFSLLALAATSTVMLGMLGLSADLGRVYVVKNELQTFVDAAAAAAAYELDGTTQGLDDARAVAASGPGSNSRNRWDFGNQAVTDVQVSYSTSASGPYEANPSLATGYRFIRVTATANLPLYFLVVFPGVGRAQVVSAVATAGQVLKNSVGEGADPFSPDAHNPLDPNFGFVPGQLYTIKWAPAGVRDTPNGRCPGDAGFTPGGGGADRGYIDVGQGDGNQALHDTIVNKQYYLSSPITLQTPIDMVFGNKHVGPAVTERINQDTDTIATSYSRYNGNGRRLLSVPVNDGTDAANVVGFATFFLPTNACGNNVQPCCAEYVGPSAVLQGHKKGAAASGLLEVTLVQ